MVHQVLPKVFATVAHMLAEAGEKSGDSVALTFEGRTLTYSEFVRCVGGFANELLGLDARHRRVAVICGNSIDMAVALFAVHGAGAQAVPINPIYTARELNHILEDGEPVAAVFDEAVADIVTPIADRLGIVQRIVVGGDQGRRLDAWKDDLSAQMPVPFPEPNDLATLQYTGGTTGLPKGVNITHGQLSVNISQREAVWPTRTDNEIVLCVMPLFHVFASAMCLHFAVYCRGKLVILPRYHPELVLKTIAQEKITRLPLGPTIFHGLMAHEKIATADFSSLQSAYSGSAPLPENTLRQWERITGCPIYEGYGQSEAGPVLTGIEEGKPVIAGSVGLPLPQTDIQIVDVETGNTVLEVGQQGEIRARGPQIMSGYRGRPKETAETLRGGWLYTGDIGELDADGILYIRDRKKDMAIVGGYNVYPREIDEVLYSHEDVVEAAAIGVPDDYRGEVIAAFVVLQESSTITADALIDYCEELLAKYKVPSRIHLVEQIPKTLVGKIDKEALRERTAVNNLKN